MTVPLSRFLPITTRRRAPALLEITISNGVARVAARLGLPRTLYQSIGGWSAYAEIPRLHVSLLLRLLVLVMTLAGVGCPHSAQAVDRANKISQYGHRVWRVGDAGLESSPMSIAQTPNGEIWVGTADGLYRFNGKQFSRWSASSPSQPQLRDVDNLIAARNGDLYVGSEAGLFRVSGDRLYKYPRRMEEPGPFTESTNGRVWFGKVGQHSDISAFCEVKAAGLDCHGTRDGVPCWSDFGILAGAGGQIWAGGYGGLCHWRPSQRTQTYPLGDDRAPVTAIALDGDRTLLASVAAGSVNTGLWEFNGSRWERFARGSLDSRNLDIWDLFQDRGGSFWIGTHGQGLYRLVGSRVDHFSHLNGLSGDTVLGVIEDREGSIWVVTPLGVDQFFDLPITRFTAEEGLSGDQVNTLAIAQDGATLIADGAYLDRISRQGTVCRFGLTPGGDRGGLIFTDSAGRAWFGADGRLLMYGPSRNKPVVNQGRGRVFGVFAIAEDTDHDVWVSLFDRHNPPQAWLWRFRHGQLVQRLREPIGVVDSMASDLAGGLWLSAFEQGFYHFHGGRFERVASLDAEARERIVQILPVSPGEAWIATQQGAVWLKDGRTRVLNTANGLPCDIIYGAALDLSGDLWLTTQCDLVRIGRTELAQWQRRPGYRVHASVYGPVSGYIGNGTSQLSRTRSGTLWFAGEGAAYKVDPGHISVNSLAPPMQIERVIADQKTFPADRRIILPKLTRNLEIDYAGFSYLQPDLLSFRYRLMGHDLEWDEVGNRRQAFYTDLAPGAYRFQVAACNKDGVCNNQGASVAILIPPAWWQTWLFRILCLFALATGAALLVRWRIAAHAEAIRARCDDRLEERTRVARDLHDTLMQTVLASKLLAESGSETDAGPKGREIFARLSEWLGQAADEGRAAVNSLRASAVPANHLGEALEFAAYEAAVGSAIDVNVTVIGVSRELHPIARDEIYRIGLEAIRNALAHSGASRIDVMLDYTHGLALRIRDNGVGIDDKVLVAGKAGHFGLIGMRERAEHIGAKLTISSSRLGTEVSLVVAGSVVIVAKSTLIGRLKRRSQRSLHAKSPSAHL